MDIREEWRKIAVKHLNKLKPQGADEILAECLNLEAPPNPQMGDVGIPMFAFAKAFKMSPAKIAEKLAESINSDEADNLGEVKVMGPYLNIFLPKGNLAKKVLAEACTAGENYGALKHLAGKKIMIEFSSPNTNKPLHLGHLRNDALGESISRILKFCGAKVFKVNIVNDRGVHICKSMLAYKKLAEGKTPESEGIKADHFVGNMYVAFNNYAKEHPEANEEAQAMLRDWEKGDNLKLLDLWQTMNNWAMSGIKETYERTGVSFDKIYFESKTYLLGKDEILKGLEKGVLYREEDNSVWVDLEPIGLDKKIVLRGDGTSLYITQDIGTAICRHGDWEFDSLIYVVANEQDYHFKVLFYLLEQLGYKWAKNLFHLSYGMVNLPEGKMKSREGTVVDADDLINKLRDGAIAEIKQKGREEAVQDPKAVAEKIALGALHYFLLQVTPRKDMLFDPKESLSFSGNTGPYLQYMGARISSILRKAASPEIREKLKQAEINPELLASESEWTLLKSVEAFPKQVQKAAEQFDPGFIANYLYELAKDFSRFYRDCPILSCEDASLMATRLELAKAVKIVLQNAMHLILVPFLETM